MLLVLFISIDIKRNNCLHPVSANLNDKPLLIYLLFCRDSASTRRTKFAQNVGELYYSGAMAGIYCFDITDKSTFQHVDQWMQKLSNSQYSKNSFLRFSLNLGSFFGDLYVSLLIIDDDECLNL